MALFFFDVDDSGVHTGDKFGDLARELECDKSEERFKDAIRRVAKAPPPSLSEPVEG